MHEAYLIDKDNLEKQKDWTTPEEAVKSLENLKILEIDISNRNRRNTKQQVSQKMD